MTTPARPTPPVGSVPCYLGQAHPSGPGVHALPAPPGVEVIGVTDARGTVIAQLVSVPHALDGRVTAWMRRWWRGQFGAALRRAAFRVVS